MCVPLYVICALVLLFFFFFFSEPSTTEIYTLSLHDALPISRCIRPRRRSLRRAHAPASPSRSGCRQARRPPADGPVGDRKSTRLNSSHVSISYAVFCLKKKKFNVINLNHYNISSHKLVLRNY